jgi:hypothetical protein
MRDSFGYGDVFVNLNTRFFFWLLMNDRLSTRNIFRRKNMHLDSYNCVPNLEETVTHFFLECPFAKNCWNLFNIVFGANSSFPEALPQIRSQINSQFFMISAILLC